MTRGASGVNSYVKPVSGVPQINTPISTKAPYISIYIYRPTTEKQRDPLQITSKNGLQCVQTPLAPLSTLLIILWMSLLYIWLAGEFVKFKFFVCLHLYPHNLSIPIFFIVFCLSPSSSSFSVCLHLNPHFLSFSIFILIFCLSPSLSPFSVCLCHLLCFLFVTIFLLFFHHYV